MGLGEAVRCRMYNVCSMYTAISRPRCRADELSSHKVGAESHTHTRLEREVFGWGKLATLTGLDSTRLDSTTTTTPD